VWSNLPSNLRTILGTALVMGIGVTLAAFALSFFALRDAASNPLLEFGSGHEWLFPIAVDMSLIFAEVLLLGFSMVKGANRAIPVLLVLAFGAGTLYFNLTRVPTQVRPIAAAVPVASLLCTIGLASLFKLLRDLSGAPSAYHAPPSAAGYLTAPGSPLQGAVWRPDASMPPAPAGWAAYGNLGTSGASTNGHPGNGAGEPEGAGGDAAVKRRQIDLYLSRLDPEGLQMQTGSSIVAALGAAGVDVSNREALRQLDSYRSTNQPKQRRGR
jgi:hypothetical protein